MLNEAEQAYSKADLCSVLANDAHIMPMCYYKCLCSIGCESKKAGGEIIRGTLEWHSEEKPENETEPKLEEVPKPEEKQEEE